ncbi:MAG: hypothetical protein A2Y40_10895, partial [Candidatus Margulisbacteria bacterium GWF2_35_9]
MKNKSQFFRIVALVIITLSTAYTYNFPTIDNFEDNNYSAAPAWTFPAPLAGTIINSASGARGNYSTRVTGTASGYWVGAGQTNLQTYLDNWNSYKYISIWVNNRGSIGDKIQIQIHDNDDGSPWSSEGDDHIKYEMQLNWQNEWRQIIIPYTLFADDNLGVGDDTINLAPYSGGPGVVLLMIGFISNTSSGAIDMFIDDIALTSSTYGTDTDNDGLPDVWENTYGLNPNSSLGNDGGNGDPDGDGITNLAEYVNGSAPTVLFPIIDNYEDANLSTQPSWTPADGLVITASNEGSTGNYSLKATNHATNYYGGYMSAYVGDKDTNWAAYNYVHLVINNQGKKGDKLKIEIFDNDNNNYEINTGAGLLGDDKFAYEFSIPNNQWKDIYIPYSVFTDINSATGDNTLNLAPANSYPGVLMIGFAISSVSQNADVKMLIDQIDLTTAIGSTDVDNDGLPDSWEVTYGINPNSSSGDDGAKGDPDGDGYTNLEEYINGTVPKAVAPITDVYEVREGAGNGASGAWGPGSQFSSYKITGNYYHQLKINDNSYLAKTGMWIGLTNNADEPIVMLTDYKKLCFDAQSNNEELYVYLKDKDGNVSSKYKLFNLDGNAYHSFEISLNYFPVGSFDISAVKEILFEPAAISSVTQTLNIRNILFDKGSLITSPLNTPIVDELILQNYLSGDPYAPLTSQTNYKEETKYLWNAYKDRFINSYKSIVTQGLNLGGLVYDPYVGSSTTKIEAADYAKSEGSGYGMLLAVYMNDQNAFDEIFDGTWASQMHKSASSNLFTWNIKTDGTFVNNDKNSASDADQDIAFSLILADALVQSHIWSNTSREYDKKAQSLINALYEYTISHNKYLMPSDEAGPDRLGFHEVVNPTNPSYFSPAWYRIFDMYENNDHDWGSIIKWGYELVVSSDPSNKGLNPDWCDYWGNNKEVDHPFFTYMVGKDAIRVQWRLATDWLWFGETRAKTYLEKTKSVFAYPGGLGSIAPQSVKPLELNGAYSYLTRGDAYNYTDISFVSMFAAGAMGSDTSAYRNEWKSAFDKYMYLAKNGNNSFLGEKITGSEQKIDFDSQMNYYNHSLGILSALMVSSAFPNIYAATNMPTHNLLSPIIDSFEDGNLSTAESWTAADNINISIVNQSQNGTYSMRGKGQASNYYVGYASAYLGNTILDWSNFTYLKLIINNKGRVGDKIKIEIIDNDTPTYSVLNGAGALGDDKFAIELNMLWTEGWKEIYIPYALFTDVNPGIGNDILDIKPQTIYPGTLLLGFAFNSVAQTGRVTVDIDVIALANETNMTDSDKDGMDDNWESLNGLNPANGSDSGIDSDNDGYSNFEEYMNGTNPQVKDIFPVVDNFENTGLVWANADGLSITTASFSQSSIQTAMRMTGTATSYYSGFAGAYIGSSQQDWGNFNSLKIMLRNNGQIGDKIKIELTDNDNADYSGESGTDDVWVFEQVINTTATWSYYTIPFNYFVDKNPGFGNDSLDLAPAGTYPGVVYIGVVNLSKIASGNTDIYIDNIEASKTTTSNDNDGDGLPNDWETLY